MHTTMSGVTLTYDHVLRLPQDDLRHELIEGVHYVTASPDLRHQPGFAIPLATIFS